MGCRRKDHNQRMALRIYANQTACPLCSLCLHPNFAPTYRRGKGLLRDCEIFANLRLKLIVDRVKC